MEDWTARVAATADLARSSGGDRWLLALEEAVPFSIGFFGLLAAGKTICLPAALGAPSLRRLAPNAERALSDLPSPSGSAPWHGLPPQGGSPRPVPRLEDGTIEFWTSGSTGFPKKVTKRLSQLQAEVALQETMFGRRIGNGIVVGTVPHFHIYGCLFRVLWPLYSGRVFRSQTCAEPPELARVLRAGDPVALVSCPAHLSRLPRLLDLSVLNPPTVVFSSGGPLDHRDAAVWSRVAVNGVVEVYGSTESGGIGWRAPNAHSSSPERHLPWRPLRGVAISVASDGALVVSSTQAGPEPVRTEDSASLLRGGRFLLNGRLDRIVKVDERRVSLPEVEAALCRHPAVRSAAVALLEAPHPTLGAAIVLSRRTSAFRAPDRQQIIRSLREHLRTLVESYAVPRRWRFLAALPSNEAGKVTSDAVRALFSADGQVRPSTRAGPIRTQERDLSDAC